MPELLIKNNTLGISTYPFITVAPARIQHPLEEQAPRKAEADVPG